MKTLVLLCCLALCLGTAHSQSNANSCSSCDSTGGLCTAKTGYVTCSCLAGYAGNGTSCTPISSCTTETCCSQGYTWDNRVGYKTCTDVDECANTTLNTCAPSSTCANRVGIYLCGNNRTVPCPTNACAFDQDCMRNATGVQCVDPCSNYKTLNGTLRLSSINSTGIFSTDRYNFGWFRYSGTGLRMQQGCIGPVKCGSAEPYTVNGSHPAIGQGVVMMNLISNAVTGCTAAGTIPVKACTGGFYVYKFTGSLTSEVYCTDSTKFVVPTLPPTTTTRPPTTTTPTTTTPTTTTPTTTTPTTTRPTTTTTLPTTTTTPTTPVKTTLPQQNITVTTLRTSKVVSFISTVTRMNGTDLTVLELNETTSVYTEVKTINALSIRTNINNSVTPSYYRTTIGASNPVPFSNMSPAQVTGNDTTVPNMQTFQPSLYVSVPPRTTILTETSTTNNNNVTSTITTTTITTEQIVVKV